MFRLSTQLANVASAPSSFVEAVDEKLAELGTSSNSLRQPGLNLVSLLPPTTGTLYLSKKQLIELESIREENSGLPTWVTIVILLAVWGLVMAIGGWFAWKRWHNVPPNIREELGSAIPSPQKIQELFREKYCSPSPDRMSKTSV